MMTKTNFKETLFEALVDDTDGSGGLTQAQGQHEPANFCGTRQRFQ